MSSRATAAAFSLSVTIVLVAIGVGGCGDDEETESAGLPIEAVAPTEPADPDATREPQNLSELAEFPVLARGNVDQAVPAIRGSGTQTISQWLDTLVNNVANFWQQEFNLAGYEFKTVNYVVYSQPVTGCGGDLGSLGKGPAYCWGEYKMYLSVPYFQNFYGKIGDAAMAIPVAHRNGPSHPKPLQADRRQEVPQHRDRARRGLPGGHLGALGVPPQPARTRRPRGGTG